MSPPTSSRQWRVVAYPGVDFDPFKTFNLEDSPIPDLKANQVLVKTTHFSNDPAQRTWVTDRPADRHYTQPVRVGDLMNAICMGVIAASRHSKFKEGDRVFGAWGWREYAVLDPSKLGGLGQLRKLPEGVDPSDAMALGLTAWTAYIGLLKIGNPKPTDKCVVVSGAAGATGSSVTQIAKNVLGIERVVGIAGTAEKCKMLTSQCGCDVALNYKSPNFEQELKEATPGFVDIYFDNTGGRILDLCVKRMKEYGRVVSCGAISSYDKDASTAMSLTAESYFLVVTQKLIIQGFVVIEPRFEKDLEECEVKLTEWASEGKLKPLKTVWKAGFDEVPGGMIKLLRGENTGKLVTELKDRGASTL